MITAPREVVHTWQEEASRLLHATRTPDLPPAVMETLYHASVILLSSAINATPGGVELFSGGLAGLYEEIRAAQRNTGGARTCPRPDKDGTPHKCSCPAGDAAACAQIAYDIAAAVQPAGDNGCEGGAA